MNDAGPARAVSATKADAGPADVCNRQSIHIMPSAAAEVPCVFELRIESLFPRSVHVLLDDRELLRDEDYTLRGRQVVLGTTCALLRDARPHHLELRQDCEHLISL